MSTVNDLDERQIPYELIIRILERLCFEDRAYASYSAAVLVFMPGLAEIRRLHDMISEHKLLGDEQLFWIYTLHSTIASENQAAVFDIPPLGVRKIVIASNIAETGITIPDITCVIDTGKHREMRLANYDRSLFVLIYGVVDLTRSVKLVALSKYILPGVMQRSVAVVLGVFKMASAFTSLPRLSTICKLVSPSHISGWLIMYF